MKRSEDNFGGLEDAFPIRQALQEEWGRAYLCNRDSPKRFKASGNSNNTLRSGRKVSVPFIVEWK